METRIWGHLRDLEDIVHRNPALAKIMDEDPRAETNPFLRNHIKDQAFQVGYDFLGLIRTTAKIVEKNKYDKTKIRRRIEEHLRKYGRDQSIITLALFLNIPVD